MKFLEKTKNLFFFVIFYSNLIYFFRLLYMKRFNNPIKILYTHRVIDKNNHLFKFMSNIGFFTIEEFEKKIKYLSKLYKFISLDQCCEYLIDIKKRVPNCIVLTFDDGYKCIYTKFFPILKKYSIPATVFLSVGFIENKIISWSDNLIYLIGETRIKELKIPELSEQTYSLTNFNEKIICYKQINTLLKKIDNNLKKDIMEKMIIKLRINRQELENQSLMLNWGEIREMFDSGLISFGSHTLTHPILTRVKLEEAEFEIFRSKMIIEDVLGHKIKFFAYPNGGIDDINEAVINCVRKSGFSCALTTISHYNNNRSENLFTLGREGFDREPFYMFGLKVAGFFNLVARLKTNKR